MPLLEEVTVGQVARRSPVYALRESDTVQHLILMLQQFKVLSFPVFDDEQECVGMVDSLDLVCFLRDGIARARTSCSTASSSFSRQPSLADSSSPSSSSSSLNSSSSSSTSSSSASDCSSASPGGCASAAAQQLDRESELLGVSMREVMAASSSRANASFMEVDTSTSLFALVCTQRKGDRGIRKRGKEGPERARTDRTRTRTRNNYSTFVGSFLHSRLSCLLPLACLPRR